MVPSTDESHYLTGAISIADGLRSGSLKGAWEGYRDALGFKAPLVCVPAALLMLAAGGLVLPAMLSLVLTFFALGLASYSVFRRVLEPARAALASVVLLSMPMITGLTHRFYVELLLVLLCVVYLDLLLRNPWRRTSIAALAGAVAGLGALCKTTFPVLIAAPTLYSFWMTLRGSKRPLAAVGRLAVNAALAFVVAAAVAGPWYEHNWREVLRHARFAATLAMCYYPRWIQADISAGPGVLLFLAAAAGLPIVVARLWKRRDSGSAADAWILLLLLGAVTAVLTGVTINKATRFTVTWLPALAALSLAACRFVEERWRRLRRASFVLAGVSVILALHLSFAILPVGAVRFADLRILDTRFPLNVPGWYDDNHPLDRRDFGLAAAAAVVERDARARFKPGELADARTTALGLLLSFDYFAMLARAHKAPLRWLCWSCSPDPEPEYVLVFEGFRQLYSGIHYFDFYPAFQADTARGAAPYRLLSRVQGDSGAAVLVYAQDHLAAVARAAPSPGDVVLEAESFSRGNAAVDRGEYGASIGVVLTQRPSAAVEYDFEAPGTADYQVRLRYAAGTPRPVVLAVDGKVLSRSAAGGATGGWSPDHQRWEGAGRVHLERGPHTLRIESGALFPHIDQIQLRAVRQ